MKQTTATAYQPLTFPSYSGYPFPPPNFSKALTKVEPEYRVPIKRLLGLSPQYAQGVYDLANKANALSWKTTKKARESWSPFWTPSKTHSYYECKRIVNRIAGWNAHPPETWDRENCPECAERHRQYEEVKRRKQDQAGPGGLYAIRASEVPDPIPHNPFEGSGVSEQDATWLQTSEPYSALLDLVDVILDGAMR